MLVSGSLSGLVRRLRRIDAASCSENLQVSALDLPEENYESLSQGSRVHEYLSPAVCKLVAGMSYYYYCYYFYS